MTNDGVDLKYGKITTERGSIPDDEPVFLIRASDSCAADAIVEYHRIACEQGATTEFTGSVVMALKRFAEWGGKRKLAD